MKALFYPQSSRGALTFLAFEGHAGFQVVHLHLQSLEGEVILTGLALVGDEDEDDDDEQEAASGRDAGDGGHGEHAVRQDVHGAGGDVEAAHLDLGTVQEHARHAGSDAGTHARGAADLPGPCAAR